MHHSFTVAAQQVYRSSTRAVSCLRPLLGPTPPQMKSIRKIQPLVGLSLFGQPG